MKGSKFAIRLILLITLSISIWILTPSSPKDDESNDHNPTMNISKSLQDVILYLQQPEDIVSRAEILELQQNLKKIIRYIDRVFSLHNSSSTNIPTPSPSPYVCPEVFTGYANGYPHFINGSWEVQECETLVPFHTALSLVIFIDDDDLCSARLPRLLNSFLRDNIEHEIFLGVRERSACLKISVDESHPNLNLKLFPNSARSGTIWNKLIAEVTTPFTLVGRNLDDFNWLANLERQVSVFSVNSKIKIVGGSIRNKTGHWQVGCYQSRLISYILKYKDGYRRSMNECMVCDHLLGPFIADTEFLQNNNFNENLTDAVLFEAFFLKIKPHSILVLNCPDAMYMSTDPGEELRISNKSTWLPLVRRISLNRVALPDGVIHHFTCEESKFRCSELYSVTSSLTMPLCCMTALTNGLKQIHEYFVKNDIFYQITGGTLMGAVKLRNIMPWDFDGDVLYYTKDDHFFTQEFNLSNEVGEVLIDNINLKAQGYFKVSTPDAYIEFTPLDNLTGDIYEFGDVFVENPTLVRIKGVWVYAPPSPGLITRNMYGPDCLKHANSWWSLGIGWEDQYNVTGEFSRCQNVPRHACLDQFKADGSVQFDFI